MLKFKVLCDRCLGDQKAFKTYSNAYNSGRCFNCNSHGYIITKDEIKARESHIKYFDTIKRKIATVEDESKKEIISIQELKQFEQSHQSKHKEIYTHFENVMKKAVNDPTNIELHRDEIQEVNKRLNATRDNEYKANEMILTRELKTQRGRKESAIKELEIANQFYINLIQPVSE